MMLPAVPGKERPDFVLRMFAALMEQGTTGLSDEEFDELRDRLREVLDGANPGVAPEGSCTTPAAGGG